MRYYVEINDDIVDSLVCEACNYNLTADMVANLRDMLEAEGYAWAEVAYVWEQRGVVAA